MSENVTRMVALKFKKLNAQLSAIHASSIAETDDILYEMEILEQCIRNGMIKIGNTDQSSDKENFNTANETVADSGDVTGSEDGPKRKGRPRKRTTNVLHGKRTESSSTAMSDSPGAASLSGDSRASSASSTRSKRAAAQAVSEKMERVKNLMGNKKLRRPTDFDDFKKPLPADVSSPPTKSRKTRSKQSAGSNSDETEEKAAVFEEQGNLKEDCKIMVQRISTPEVLKIVNKRKSEDLIGQATPPSAVAEDPAKSENANVTQTMSKEEPRRKRQKGGKSVDSEVSSSENKRSSPQQISPIVNVSISAALGKALAHSSPESHSGSAFHGFAVEPVDEKRTRSKRGKQTDTVGSDQADVVAEKSIHIDQRVTRKTVAAAEAGSDVEVVETETNIRSRTKVLKKVNDAVEENSNQTYVCEGKEDGSRTRVIRKELDENHVTEQISEIPRTRTRVIKKEPAEEVLTEDTRSRTKVLKKSNEQEKAVEVEIDDSPVVEIKPLPKTQLSKTSSQSSDDETKSKYKKKKAEEGKVTPESQLADVPTSRSPVKGELVRKRVEDYEKIRQNKDQEGAPSTGTRVTRQASRIKATTEPRGKTPSSLPRPMPTPVSTAVIHRPVVEDTEARMKEEKRIARKAKEEEVARNKEKLLKASAEETKRKREEKNQKVAAAREAAEREKALLAAKAEKEKEEKLRQIHLEKEKQKKEEMMKKKLLMQQKTKEHEERRRQEEAARLARLKEQEEEHKRALAMKEREMEQQRLQKAAEQRLAEAEKSKQTAKLNKTAIINSAKAKAGTSTPTASNAQKPDSYEITPARDERSLLEPKTETDYGIDDANSSDSSEDEENPRKVIPAWAQPHTRRTVLKHQKFITDSMRDAFFENNPRMPDPTEIFKGFAVKKRIRTSSAVWRTPPLNSKR